MIPQGKEWRAKTSPEAEAVKPQEEVVNPPKAVKSADQAVKPGSPETPPNFASSVPMACDDKLSSLPATGGARKNLEVGRFLARY
jgi:hypothetical protein